MRKITMSRTVLAVLTAGLVLAALPTQAAGPCRLADTRNADGPSGGPILAANVSRSFPVQGLCSVPVGAKAVSVNLTAVGPAAVGFLTLYPSGITRPVVSTLNYSAGESAIANGAIVPLGASATQDLALAYGTVGGGTTHAILDVTGYFQ
jgi:hypothetical protein